MEIETRRHIKKLFFTNLCNLQLERGVFLKKSICPTAMVIDVAEAQGFSASSLTLVLQFLYIFRTDQTFKRHLSVLFVRVTFIVSYDLWLKVSLIYFWNNVCFIFARTRLSVTLECMRPLLSFRWSTCNDTLTCHMP